MLRETFRVIIYFFFIFESFSELCNENDISEDVYDVASAVKLASTVSCEGGFFSVQWNGSVKLFESISVGENTTLRIQGIGNATLDGSGITQLFSVGRNSTLNLEDILLTGGFATFGGAVFLDSGTKLYLRNCVFFENYVLTAGAAIYASEYAMLDIYRTVFRYNSVILHDNGKIEGGAILAGNYSYINIAECNFIGNAAIYYANISASTFFESSSCYEQFQDTYSIHSCCRWSYSDSSSSSSTVSSSSSTVSSLSSRASSSSSTISNPYITYFSSVVHKTSSTTLASQSNYPSYSSSYSTTEVMSYYKNNFGFDPDITELSSGGAIAVHSFCVLNISKSLFKLNIADLGGAIAVIGEGSSFSIVKTEFMNNHAKQSGGSIFISNKNPENSSISKSIFFCNLAVSFYDFSNLIGNSDGGAVSIKSSSESKVIIEATEFSNNYASGVGGGIDSQASLDIIGCKTVGNYAGNGGFMSMSGDVLQVTTTNIIGNEAKFAGGGIHIFSKYVTISHSNFYQNCAKYYGGSMHMYSSISSQANISTTLFLYEISATGGALYISSNTVINLFDSNFIRNRGFQNGGAIYANTDTQIKAVNTSFSGNKSYFGGAIWSNGNLTLEYCNGNNNKVLNLGGFLHLGYGASATISNSYFLGNKGYEGGGIYLTGGSRASIRNVIFEASYAAQAGAAIFTYSYHLNVAYENVTFYDSIAHCCHAKSVYIESQNKFSCVDVDIGYGSSYCCTSSQFVPISIGSGAICLDCGPAFQCNALGLNVSTLSVSPGYWRESIELNEALACPYENACIGGLVANGGDEYCAEGYRGPLCAVCSAGYILAIDNSCMKCGDGIGAVTTILVLIILLFLCFVIYLVIVTLLDVGHVSDATKVFRAQHITFRVRQILSGIPFEKLREAYIVLTILTQYASVTGFELPRAYATFIRLINIFNFDVQWVAAPSCSFRMKFYHKLLSTTLIPLIFLLVLAITYKICLKKIGIAQLGAEEFRNARELSKSKHVLVALVFLYLVYSTVSTVILETFNCDDDIDKSYIKYLHVDYTISCDDPRYYSFKNYAIFMILVYPIGIPVLYLYLLWGVRDKLKMIPESDRDNLYLNYDIRSSSFLWKKYRRSMWWWEIVECIRRIMLASSLIFILPGTAGQAIVSAVFATVSMVLFGIAKPIIDFHETQVYGLGCFILFGTFFSSLLLKLEFAEADDSSQVFVSAVLIALNVLLIGAAIWQLVRGYQMFKRRGNFQQNSFFGIRDIHDERACSGSQSLEFITLSNHIRSRSL